MKRLFIWYLCLLSGSAAGYAQQRNLLEVFHADSLVSSVSSNIEQKEFQGNVRMRQGNVYIDCDRAIQHITENFVELMGNVVIRQDTLTLKTDRGLYYNEEHYATTRDGIFLNDGHVTLTARGGSYHTQNKIATFEQNVFVDEPSAEIKSQQLVYFRDSSKALASDSVAIRFKSENVLIAGDTVIHYIDEKRSIFPANPVMWQVDSSWVKRDSLQTAADSLRLDTLSIVADYMRAERDSANKFTATGNVEIVRGKFSAASQQVEYLRSDSLVYLRERPTLWYESNQIRGDSIVVGLANSTIDWLQVFGAAFSVSQSKENETDTLAPPNRYNQTTGKNITFRFEDEQLHQIVVDGNAISLYFLFDKGKLNGVRKESGDKIIIDFKDGKAAFIRTLKGVEGTYFPEKFVTGIETTFNLDGFFWEEHSPVQPPMPSPFSAVVHKPGNLKK